jgi:hypothetical protein
MQLNNIFKIVFHLGYYVETLFYFYFIYILLVLAVPCSARGILQRGQVEEEVAAPVLRGPRKVFSRNSEVERVESRLQLKQANQIFFCVHLE